MLFITVQRASEVELGGVKIMVELRNLTNDWYNSHLVIVHRDYRDYPLHANNLFGERGIIPTKCCTVKRVLENPRLIILPMFSASSRSATELVDCINALLVVTGRLPICFLVPTSCGLSLHVQ